IDPRIVGRALAGSRFLHAGDARQPTHVLPLFDRRDRPMEVGVAALNFRHDAAPHAAPGLAFTVTLSEPSFDTSVDALRYLLDACLDGAAPDLLLIGPRPWFRDLRAGWATFT